MTPTPRTPRALWRASHPPGRRWGEGFDPTQVGWPLGVAREPRGGPLWVPWDRTSGVIGPQGSGKTLDLLTPALLAALGPALVTLTKPRSTERICGLPSRGQRGC